MDACKLSGYGSNATDVADGIYSFEKFADNSLTCFLSTCGYSTITISKSSINDCSNYCKNISSCKMFTFKILNDIKNCYLHESCNCNFYSSTYKTAGEAVTCIQGPIRKETTDQSNSIIHKLTDDETAQQCIDISKTNQLQSLRIPWPSIRNNTFSFNIEVKGKNIKNCFETNENLDFGVLVYIPITYMTNSVFTGIFKKCKLESKDDDKFCRYYCDCMEKFCEAVHITAFTFKDNAFKLCHISII